jgi:tetratricopeptide (TPR) repeat protein
VRTGRGGRAVAGAMAVVAAILVTTFPNALRAQGTAAAESRALAAAAQAAREGRIDDARDVLVDHLATAPSSVAALSTLYQLLVPRDRAEEVLSWAERAVSRDERASVPVRQVWIRTLQASGRTDSAVAAATRWVRARPTEPAARAALAEVLARSGQAERAVEVLREGRGTAAGEEAFTQELSSLLSGLGRYDEAAEEWETMLAWGEVGAAAVADRIRSPGVSGSDARAALRKLLSRDDAPYAAQRGALSLAVRMDDRAWAGEIARRLVGQAPAETRRLLLGDYYVDARNRSWLGEAEWAAARLERDAASEAERRQWRATRAELAMLGGDVARAEPALEELVATGDPGTETHRRSLQSLFAARLARGASPDELGPLLETYARTYPEDLSTRVDLAVELARARVRAGDLEGAGRTLDRADRGIEDAALAARLEGQRGVLALLAGRPGLARGHLETAAFVPDGDPVRRTDALLLVDALERADSTEAARLGAGMFALAARADPGPLEEAVTRWRSGDGGAAGPSLSALAAAALEREGFAEAASRSRRALVETWPDAAATPAALLELGRAASRAGRTGDARRWLERLIVTFPDHALAPAARRELGALPPPGGEAEGDAR